MTHPNEKLVRDLYAAFLAGDLDSVRAHYDPDVVWHVPGRNRLSGDVSGVDAVMESLTRLASLPAGMLHLQIHDVLASDDHVVGLISEQLEQDGKRVDETFSMVIHIKDGKVAEVWNMYFDPYARDEFWA
jgi:uncharacterized protein